MPVSSSGAILNFNLSYFVESPTFLKHGTGKDAGRVCRIVDEELHCVVKVVGLERDGSGGDESVDEGREVGDGALPGPRLGVAREGRGQQALIHEAVETHQVGLLVPVGGHYAQGDRLLDRLRLHLGGGQQAVALRQFVPNG